MELCDAVGWFFMEFCFEFSGFRKVNFHIYEEDSLFGVGESVFNSGTDCIHERHQGVNWEWELRKMKKMSSMKRFQK